WPAEHRPGGSAFRLRWSGPNGSQLWLVGHQVPVGMTAWTTATADRWLDYQCGKLKLELGAEHTAKGDRKQPAASWLADANGVMSRSQTFTWQPPEHPTNLGRRILHVQLHDDLLVLVDGLVSTAEDEAAVRAAIGTLKRK